jgi:hypothetical protein
MPSNVTLQIRLPAAVKSAAQQAAVDDGRTLSGLAAKLLRDYLIQAEYLPDVKQGRGECRGPALTSDRS